jgi:hypothetical protein
LVVVDRSLDRQGYLPNWVDSLQLDGEATVIEELLQCSCGHGISAHSGSGCEGGHRRKCSCRRTRTDVLESAIIDAQTPVMSGAIGSST